MNRQPDRASRPAVRRGGLSRRTLLLLAASSLAGAAWQASALAPLAPSRGADANAAPAPPTPIARTRAMRGTTRRRVRDRLAAARLGVTTGDDGSVPKAARGYRPPRVSTTTPRGSRLRFARSGGAVDEDVARVG